MPRKDKPFMEKLDQEDSKPKPSKNKRPRAKTESVPKVDSNAEPSSRKRPKTVKKK